MPKHPKHTNHPSTMVNFKLNTTMLDGLVGVRSMIKVNLVLVNFYFECPNLPEFVIKIKSNA